jgi:hypothetical protein
MFGKNMQAVSSGTAYFFVDVADVLSMGSARHHASR